MRGAPARRAPSITHRADTGRHTPSSRLASDGADRHAVFDVPIDAVAFRRAYVEQMLVSKWRLAIGLLHRIRKTITVGPGEWVSATRALARLQKTVMRDT